MSEQQELMSVDEVKTRLGNLDFWCEDVEIGKARFASMPVVEGSRLGYYRNDRCLPISDRGGLLNIIGIPPNALKEYENDEDLINRMIQHSTQKRATDVVRFTGTSTKVLGIEQSKGDWVSPQEVFDLVCDEINPVGVASADFYYNYYLMRIVGVQHMELARNRGDITHSGLAVKLNGSVQIGPYCYRMVCSNGMMQAYEELETLHSREMSLVEIRNIVQAQQVRATDLVSRFLSLDTVPAGQNREQVIIRLAQEFELPQSFTTNVLERLPALGDDATMYDLVNVATQTAQASKIQKDKLQIRLGEMTYALAENYTRCDSCGARLTALEN